MSLKDRLDLFWWRMGLLPPDSQALSDAVLNYRLAQTAAHDRHRLVIESTQAAVPPMTLSNEPASLRARSQQIHIPEPAPLHLGDAYGVGSVGSPPSTSRQFGSLAIDLPTPPPKLNVFDFGADSYVLTATGPTTDLTGYDRPQFPAYVPQSPDSFQPPFQLTYSPVPGGQPSPWAGSPLSSWLSADSPLLQPPTNVGGRSGLPAPSQATLFVGSTAGRDVAIIGNDAFAGGSNIAYAFNSSPLIPQPQTFYATDFGTSSQTLVVETLHRRIDALAASISDGFRRLRAGRDSRFVGATIIAPHTRVELMALMQEYVDPRLDSVAAELRREFRASLESMRLTAQREQFQHDVVGLLTDVLDLVPGVERTRKVIQIGHRFIQLLQDRPRPRHGEPYGPPRVSGSPRP